MSENKKILAIAEGDYATLRYLSGDLKGHGFDVETKFCSRMADWKKVRQELTGHASHYAAVISQHAFAFYIGNREYPDTYPSLGQHFNEIRGIVGKERPIILYEDLGGLEETTCAELKAQGLHGMDWMMTPKEVLPAVVEILRAQPSTPATKPVWLGVPDSWNLG